MIETSWDDNHEEGENEEEKLVYHNGSISLSNAQRSMGWDTKGISFHQRKSTMGKQKSKL